MTLITLHSRIHFASDVLEEALRAEIEAQGLAHALVLYPQALDGTEFLARVEEGLGGCARVSLHRIADGDDKYATAHAASAVEAGASVDVLIAFGSAEVIAHGRKCRHEIATTRYGDLETGARDGLRRRDLQPGFFVIPNVDGMPDPCLEAGPVATFRTTPPGVIICDPTLIAEAAEAEIARAVALTAGRALNVLGTAAFNPLADGLAIDALSRLRSDGQDRHRDLMAATLNGAIALQKGTGLVEALRFSFGKAVGRDLDSALLHRVLLARMLSSSQASNGDVIARVLGVETGTSLGAFVADFLADLDLPERLREMDLDWSELQEAVGFMEPKFGTPQAGSRAELETILQDVY